jgi:phospholipase C
MRARTTSVLVGLLCAACAVAAGTACAVAAAPATDPRTRTPIAHFLTLMQEGHSFDNYFGTYPGADGIPPGTCVPVDPAFGRHPCVRPFLLGERSAGLPHGPDAFATQYNGGRMDGFVAALSRLGIEHPRAPMGFHDARDLPYYWNLADDNVLFDRFFAASSGGSVPNHMYWVSGTNGWAADPDEIPPGGFGRTTIFDRLQARGISWKVYVEDLDPRVTFRSDRHATQVAWMPLLAYSRFLDDPARRSHIVDLSELFTDADRGTLPAVAYIVPRTSSEHPPGSVDAGVRLVRHLVNALSLSPDWPSSALLVTYDNWGGWYDHVKPSRVDAQGNGFRVPAMLIGPYARRHVVDHTPLDTTSVLRFIEDNWNLKPLARRDARAASLAGAFDFAAGPRPPAILPLDRRPPAVKAVRVQVIYAGYGGAALFTALLLTWVMVGVSRDRHRARPRRVGGRR